ncbi:MAG TPA: hypothetical protein VKR53_03900 [Puia sp.]|nr:hypothetical protein [Puia sp.]
MGDFPVPPTARFPTQITGKLKLVEAKIFLLKRKFRVKIMNPYIIEKGNNKIRMGLNSGKLKFITTITRIYYREIHENIRIYPITSLRVSEFKC